jgi:hypothetical protein
MPGAYNTSLSCVSDKRPGKHLVKGTMYTTLLLCSQRTVEQVVVWCGAALAEGGLPG